MSATTDSLENINFDWDKQPGVTNLLQILALLSHKSQQAVNKEWEGKSNYGELKKAVAKAVEELLSKLQQKIQVVDKEQLVMKLESDEKKAEEIASAVLHKAQQAVGLRP